jgi:hypothetical protein
MKAFFYSSLDGVRKSLIFYGPREYITSSVHNHNAQLIHEFTLDLWRDGWRGHIRVVFQAGPNIPTSGFSWHTLTVYYDFCLLNPAFTFRVQLGLAQGFQVGCLSAISSN